MPPNLDLNADVGEGVGDDADETALIALVTSANIACGAHAGDERSMVRAVEAAVANVVAIGAHPGHDDRENFGRTAHPLDEHSACDLVAPQLEVLQHLCDDRGAGVRYVKLHGALYHQAEEDEPIARGVVRAVTAADRSLALLGQPNGVLSRIAGEHDVRFGREAFADRAYRADGRLVARGEADALLTAGDAAEQAARLATRGEVVAMDGSRVTIACDSLCVHGDHPGAIATARSVRDALAERGVTLQAFTA
ncbi:MAG: 5-oxoprolinase subunit PxpA [Planctomycetota bacterium]